VIGDVLEALFIGGQPVLVGDLAPDVTVEEQLQDTVTITEHPVQQGAAITDHAFSNPSEVALRLAWTDSKGFLSAAASLVGLDGGATPSPDEAYQRLREMQAARQPITVVTTRRGYSNMLIRSLGVMTDDKTSNILAITVLLRQIIVVSTVTTSSTMAPASDQAEPQKTAPISNAGNIQPKAVAQSALSGLAGIFGF
jgi:hypothetical protein